MQQNLYLVLGVAQSATPEEIKQQYKKLAFRYHPDLHPGNAQYEERFKAIASAYAVLSDPGKRSLHDYRLRQGVFAAAQRETYKQAETFAHATRPGAQYGPGRPTSPPPRRARVYAGPHYVFVAVFAFSCIAMLTIWLGDIMNRNAAKTYTGEGNYVEALRFDSTYSDAWHLRAARFAAVGRDSEAAAYFTKAILLSDTNPAYWRYQLGRSYLRLARFDLAQKALAQALPKLSSKDSCRYLLAAVAMRTGKPCQAVFWLDKCSLPFKNSSGFALAEGYNLYHCGNFAAAIPQLEAAAAMGANTGAAYYLAGVAHLKRADTAAACIDFDLALNNGHLQAADALRSVCR